MKFTREHYANHYRIKYEIILFNGLNMSNKYYHISIYSLY